MSAIPYIILFGVVALVALIAGWYNYKKKSVAKNKIITHPLKSRGEAIKVNFIDCEILTREYFEEAVSDSFPSRVEMLDSVYSPNNKGGEKIKREVSVITYNHIDPAGNGITYKSRPIYMQADLLRFRLVEQKDTVLYVDPFDRTKYYFDIDFLG